MLTLLLLLVLAGEPPPAEFGLTLLFTDGGENPGEERFELAADGAVVHHSWRLATPEPVEQQWTIGTEGVEKVRAALARCRFREFTEALNQASGAGAAYTVQLEVLEGGRSHAVLAYRFGSPLPSERFLKLVERIRGILTAGGRFPAPP
jgi:hypothetical protein